jgi:Flp pilus assembly pilin Flp
MGQIKLLAALIKAKVLAVVQRVKTAVKGD